VDRHPDPDAAHLSPVLCLQRPLRLYRRRHGVFGVSKATQKASPMVFEDMPGILL
jgi:hypothetical protein